MGVKRLKAIIINFGLAILFGLAALLIVVADIHFTLPGSQLLTDPREVFVLIGSALSGPLGGILVGFVASLYDPNPAVGYWVMAQHIWGAFWFGLIYYKWIYPKLEMPLYIIAWNLLIISYYYIFDLPMWAGLKYFFPELYSAITGGGGAFWEVVMNIHYGWLPEVIFTALITSLILIATPDRFRAPILIKHSEIERIKFRLFSYVRSHFFSKSYLGFRLAVWYLVFSLIPLFVVLLFVNNNVKTAFMQQEAETLTKKIEAFANIHNCAPEKCSHAAIKTEKGNFIFTDYNITELDQHKVRFVNIVNKYKVGFKTKDNFKFTYEDDVNYEIIVYYKSGNDIFICEGNSAGIRERVLELESASIKNLGISFFLISLIGGILTFLIVVKPISSLTVVAEEVSNGKYETFIDDTNIDDEIRILASSFNKMIRNINSAYQNLRTEISERKKIEESLIIAREIAEKSDKLKSEFLAQVSHEIRTPINSILNFTSLIKEETQDKISSDLKESFDIIDSGGRRLIRTVDSILNLSQLQMGNFEIIKSEFDIIEQLDLLSKEFEINARSKGLDFIFYKPDSAVQMNTDQYIVSQIVSNILDNAVKYTFDGKIDLSIEDQGDKLLVTISDTGIGISESFSKEMFQPFTQEQQGYTRKFEGNGLGLALVEKYAAIIGAEISFESTKNSGTVFRILFNKYLQTT